MFGPAARAPSARGRRPITARRARPAVAARKTRLSEDAIQRLVGGLDAGRGTSEWGPSPGATRIQRKVGRTEPGVRVASRAGEGRAAPAATRIRRRDGAGRGLPPAQQAAAEDLSGLALDDVRVHYDSPEPARIRAFAYTRGADIFVAPGQRQHVPHETWHVVQQMRGRVPATGRLAVGAPVNDDTALEREADAMGAQIARATPTPVAPVRRRPAVGGRRRLIPRGRGARQVDPHVDPARRPGRTPDPSDLRSGDAR